MPNNTLQKRIMRRVYYAFAIRMATHKIVLTGLALLASVYALSVFIHVASIVRTLVSIPPLRVPYYVGNAFLHTDFYTLLSVCLVVLSVYVFGKALHGLTFGTYTHKMA